MDRLTSFLSRARPAVRLLSTFSLAFASLRPASETFAAEATVPAVRAERDDTPRRFDVGAGPAVDTLRLAARQGAMEIVFTERTVTGVQTRPLRGLHRPGEAMALLLTETGLEAVRDAETGIFTLRRVAPATAEVNEGAKERSADGTVSLVPFVVTGSNIPRVDYETVQPVTILDDRDVRSGAVGTPLELMNRLPFLGSLSAYENQDGGRTRGSASSINLRGLGGQNTLLLFNGRRLPYYSLPLGALVFYNINNLPMMAVSRIEVLRDGASAIYGADATAGVVNFISRRQSDERRLSFRFGDTFDGVAPEYRASIVDSRTFNSGNSRILVTLDAYRRDTLMARDRDFAVLGDKRGRVPEPFGSSPAWNHLTNLAPLASFTVNPAAGQPNRLPGLTVNTAHVADTGALVPGARNPAAYYNDAGFFSLVPGRESFDVFLTLDHRLRGGSELFAELGYNDVKSTAVQAPMTLASSQNRDANDQLLVIPASNYYNPYGSRFYGPGTANPSIAPRAVQFNTVEEAIGPRVGLITTQQDRALLGWRGRVAGAWDWETAALYSSNEARDTTENLISRSALTAALARATPDALNLFAGPGKNPESVLAPLRTTSHLGGRSSLLLADAKLNGTLWSLPAGALTAAAGLEYREEKMRSDHAANYLANDLVNTAGQDNFRADRDVRSAFLELLIPVVRAPERTWFRRAEMQLAGRWENFSGFGSARKPKAGVAVTLLPSILARASIGRGFRAPTLTQLYGSEGRSMAARVDPFRPQDGNVRRLMRQPPVPTLKPEQSESRTVGLALEPRFVPGLSLGIDWWRYELSDQINVIGRDTQLALEAAGGPYSNPNVVRVPATSAEPIGAITAVIEPWQNFARAETEGYDVNLAYALGAPRRGRVTVGVDASYIHTYEVQLAAGGPVESFPTDDNRPRLRTVGRLEFERKAWRAQVLSRFTSDYKPSDPVVVGGQSYRMPSHVTWDSSVSRRFGSERAGSGLSVTLGVNNVFDRDPPLYPVRQGYDARQFSPQGRFGYVHVAWDY